jgi:hypothetical protein
LLFFLAQSFSVGAPPCSDFPFWVPVAMRPPRIWQFDHFWLPRSCVYESSSCCAKRDFRWLIPPLFPWVEFSLYHWCLGHTWPSRVFPMVLIFPYPSPPKFFPVGFISYLWPSQRLPRPTSP